MLANYDMDECNGIRMTRFEIEIPPLEPENGPELAYGTLVHDLDSLRELDERSPIVGSFRIETIPESRFVPKEVREQWIGIDIPVRFPETLIGGGVEFTDEDAILSLLMSGKIEAARWFSKNLQSLTPGWCFQVSEGTLTDSNDINQEPMTSLEYYGAILTPETRGQINATTRLIKQVP